MFIDKMNDPLGYTTMGILCLGTDVRSEYDASVLDESMMGLWF